MGISGLLPLLAEAQRKGHVSEFAGQTVGVDSYIWLYKGAFSCAVDIGLGRETDRYVTSFMTRARMLRHHKVEPLFVFDGGLLPSKRETELERHRNRKQRRAEALKFWAAGKRKGAFELFQKCLEATPQMARRVVDALRAEGFAYLVAPYEADAQLAYLEREGVISAAISEDSDLIVFGCRRVVFKMDQYGAATLFDRERMERTRAVDLRGWGDAGVRRMAILSGCDYVASPPGIGLKKAYRYLVRATDMLMAVKLMRADGVCVPEGYEDAVVRAELTFLYQRVYDPRTRSMAHVTAIAGSQTPVQEMPFIGEELDADLARRIAECLVDPITREPFGPAALPAEEPAASKVAASPRSGAPKKAPSPKRKPTAAGTLVGLWKKRASQLAPITVQPRPKVVAAAAAEEESCDEAVSPTRDPAAAEEEDAVRVRFRARDTKGQTVATGQSSKFFASKKAQPSAEPAVSEEESPEPALSQTQVDDAESQPVLSVEADLSQQSTQVPDTAAESTTGVETPKSQRDPPLTPLSQLGKRLSANPSPQSPSSLKRKLQGFSDSLSKFRCAPTTPTRHLRSTTAAATCHIVDDIVDCSDSEKENSVCV
ncbi:hypothetical protein GGF46_003904 [Coemansia sp. RSA 552]|nr:hypothetical protein GGF46_003904 [Coemansia sp. RSA 552]